MSARKARIGALEFERWLPHPAVVSASKVVDRAAAGKRAKRSFRPHRPPGFPGLSFPLVGRAAGRRRGTRLRFASGVRRRPRLYSGVSHSSYGVHFRFGLGNRPYWPQHQAPPGAGRKNGTGPWWGPNQPGQGLRAEVGGGDCASRTADKTTATPDAFIIRFLRYGSTLREKLSGNKIIRISRWAVKSNSVTFQLIRLRALPAPTRPAEDLTGQGAGHLAFRDDRHAVH